MAIESTEALNSVPFDFWTALIASVFGLASGIVASLVSPWVHYFIDKRKNKYELKKESIDSIRNLLDSGKTLREIMRSSSWGFIDLHLNESERNSLITDDMLVAHLGGDDQTNEDQNKQVISKMIARLEKEWLS